MFLWFGLVEIDSSSQLTNHHATCVNKKSKHCMSQGNSCYKGSFIVFQVLPREPLTLLGCCLINYRIYYHVLCIIYNICIHNHTYKYSKKMGDFHKLSAIRFCMVVFFQKSQNIIRTFSKNKMKKKAPQTFPPFPSLHLRVVPWRVSPSHSPYHPGGRLLSMHDQRLRTGRGNVVLHPTQSTLVEGSRAGW